MKSKNLPMLIVIHHCQYPIRLFRKLFFQEENTGKSNTVFGGVL
jgi:hypothetical protein